MPVLNSKFYECESFLIFVVLTAKCMHAVIYVYLLLNLICFAQLDSGADICVIRQSVVDKMSANSQVNMCKSRFPYISMANGKKEPVLGNMLTCSF